MNGNGLAYSMMTWVKYENYFLLQMNFVCWLSRLLMLQQQLHSLLRAQRAGKNCKFYNKTCPKFNTIKSKAVNSRKYYEKLGGYKHLRPPTQNFGGDDPPCPLLGLRPCFSLIWWQKWWHSATCKHIIMWPAHNSPVTYVSCWIS